MALPAGSRLGPYEILAPLGAGGMGEVYRACDTRLGREVAVKLIPASLLSDEVARKRFQHEAKTLSTLSHPNIASLYEFDSDQGIEFLVMELVSGESLRKRLARGALSPDQIVELGSQLMEGLAAAHDKGIVHRDLKPENVVISDDGRLKILDFGASKMLPEAMATAATAGEKLTQPGAVVGTLPYMAPEQLRDEEVDARTDIYAAGVVLYEMVTGQPAFSGRGLTLVREILEREPRAPSAVRASVPPALEMLIAKAMDKDPRRRYQSARDMLVDVQRLGDAGRRRARPVLPMWVRAWKQPLLALAIASALGVGIWVGARSGSPSAGASIRSLAVLPLSNLSGDPQQEYFADGMTEELTSDLAKLGGVRVISRTSVMQYKSTKKTVPEIARELNVDAVIEGSVLRDGKRVRITAQLIDARADRHLWADSYDGDLNNVLDLQRNVAGEIARRVQSNLTPAQRQQLNAHRSVDPQVLDLYLRGLYQADQGTADSMDAALALFRQALAKDPSYAPAYAQIAAIDTNLGVLSIPPKEIMPEAKANAEKALALDDSLSEAHVVLAEIHLLYDWDWSATRREIDRGLELDPNNPDAHLTFADLLTLIGEGDRALAEYERAIRLAPNSAMLCDAIFFPGLSGRADAALENARKIMQRPQPGFCHAAVALAYSMKGQHGQAVAEGETAHRLDESPLITSFLAAIYARAGRRAEAEHVLASLNEQLKTHYSCSYEVAVVYLELGQKDEAFHWFDKAYEQRSDCMALLKVDARLDRVHDDPRYQKLLKQLSFP